MKKLCIFIALAIAIFASCESKSGKKYSSFGKFKHTIENSRLDSSCVVNGDKGTDYYTFYLPKYKIDIHVEGAIPFESGGEISIFTRDIAGEFVSGFCTGPNNWTEEQKKEILDLLLKKKRR